MELTKEEKQVLKKLSAELKSRFGAIEVLLYGSAVRGDMDEESDIDIFVVLPGKADWEIEKQIIDLCFETSLECGRTISVICYSQEQLQTKPMKYSVFVETVKSTGQAI